MLAIFAAPWPAAACAPSHRPRACRSRPTTAAAAASEPAPGGRDGAAAALLAACLEAGVRVEAPSAAEAPLWDDDYLEIVAEAEDAWGREPVTADGEPPPRSSIAADASAPTPDAYASLPPLSAAALLARMRAPGAPLVVDVSPAQAVDDDVAAADGSPASDALRLLRVPLAGLAQAARDGRLGARGGDGGPVAVARASAGGRVLARQAAVRLRAVLGFPGAMACDDAAEELLKLVQGSGGG